MNNHVMKDEEMNNLSGLCDKNDNNDEFELLIDEYDSRAKTSN